MQGRDAPRHGGTLGKAAIGAVVGCLLATFGLVLVLIAVKHNVGAQEAVEVAATETVFLRPGSVAPGGTYELYVDVQGAAFTEKTVVTTDSLHTAVLKSLVRNAEGLTVVVGVAATQPLGRVALTLQTPRDTGTQVARAVLKVVTPTGGGGPSLTFTNLPKGEKVVSEGAFAHLELSVEGDGPFVVQYGLRDKPFWASRPWNFLRREMAVEKSQTVEGAESEAFVVPLPAQVNTIDVVAIDRNGRETHQSLVIETAKPCKLETATETGLLENLFGKKIAFASCESTNPTFNFYNTATTPGVDYRRDDFGNKPLLFTASTCQGTICTGCASCGSSEDYPLDDGAIGGGGGASPAGAVAERGKVFGHSGEYKYTVTDLSLDVPGLDFSIRRTYRSQISYHSRLGRNWDMNIFARYLRIGTVTGGQATASGHMYFYRGDGRRDKYTWLGGTNFQSPDGFYDKFAFSASSASQEIRMKDGRRMVFTESQIGSNTVYGKLSYIYGRIPTNYLQFGYDVSGKLTAITSSMGVKFNLYYNGSGYLWYIFQDQNTAHTVMYTQDATGQHDARLQKVEYSTTTFWEYNSTQLIEYTNRRRTAAYTYELSYPGTSDLKYNLLTVVDGRGNFSATPYPVLTLTYVPGVDKVQCYETGHEVNPGFDPEKWAHTSTELFYSTEGNNPVVTCTFNGYKEVESTAMVPLSKVILTFDAFGKGGVIKKSVLTGDDIDMGVWEYERECTCNKITEVKDPSGRFQWFTCDSYGNIVKHVVDNGDNVENDADLVTLYKFDVPYYVNSTKFGGIRARADPNVVSGPTQSIDDSALDYKKTVYTPDPTNGNLQKVEPPWFHDASEFSGVTWHQGWYEYTYDSYGQKSTETVYLDSTVLHRRKFEYFPSGTFTKGLLSMVTENPGQTDPSPLVTTYSYNNWRDVTSVTDARGKVTNYARGTDRLVISVQPPASPGCGTNERRDSRYDPNGNLVYTDVGGNADAQRFGTYHRFDQLNQRVYTQQEVLKESGTVTIETETKYDGAGRVVLITKTGGQSTRMVYTEAPRPQGGALSRQGAALSPEGGGLCFVADVFRKGAGEPEFLVSRTWTGTSHQLLEARTYLEESTYAGRWVAYDAFGRQDLTVTSPDTGDLPDGQESRFLAELITRDRNGNQLQIERSDYATLSTAAAVLHKESYTYVHCVKTDFDELGRRIRLTQYQDYIRPGASEDPTTASGSLISLTRHGFDGRIVVHRRVLPMGNADTTYFYDNISRVRGVFHPDGQSSTEYEREDGVNVTVLHVKEYDPLLQEPGDPTVKDYITRFAYDDQGRVTKQTVEGYDNANHALAFQSTSMAYDYRGNLTSTAVLDQATPGTALVVNEAVFDGLNRLVNVTYDKGEAPAHLSLVNQVSYNDAARTVTRRDGMNQDTVFTLHKVLSSVTQVTYASDSLPDNWDREFFRYDNGGRLLSYAAGVQAVPPWEVEYTYDLLGRVKERIVNEAQAGEEAKAEFTYDWQGRVLSAQSRLAGSVPGTWDSTVTCTYNALFLTAESQSGFRRAGLFTVNSGFDTGARRIQLQYPKTEDYAQTRTLSFYPNSFGGATAIVDSGEGTLATCAYAGVTGRVRRLDLYAATTPRVRKDIEYNHLLQPRLTVYKRQDASVIQSYTEGWGDGTTATSPVFSCVSFQKSSDASPRAYAYDGLNRLLSVTIQSDPPAKYGYSYDGANNRSTKDLPGEPPNPDFTYTYNLSNEIDTATGFESLTHDSHGNLTLVDRTSGIDQTFTYDKLNRLVMYDPSEGDSWRYFYDAFGRRVLKERANATEDRLYSYYDGHRVLLEVATQTFQNPPDVRGEVRGEYIYGDGIDEVLVEHLLDTDPNPHETRRFWPLCDSLGTVRDLADLDGNVGRLRMSYEIDAEGNLLAETAAAQTSPVTQDVLHAGRWIDRETRAAVEADGGLVGALYNYRAREYDPELQRFLQREPIGAWVDPVSIGNAFAYAGNDVVNLVDPTGDRSVRPGLRGGRVRGGVRRGVGPNGTDTIVLGGTVDQWGRFKSDPKVPEPLPREVLDRIIPPSPRIGPEPRSPVPAPAPQPEPEPEAAGVAVSTPSGTYRRQTGCVPILTPGKGGGDENSPWLEFENKYCPPPYVNVFMCAPNGTPCASFDGMLGNTLLECKWTGSITWLNQEAGKDVSGFARMRRDKMQKQFDRQLEVATACGYSLLWLFSNSLYAGLAGPIGADVAFPEGTGEDEYGPPSPLP